MEKRTESIANVIKQSLNYEKFVENQKKETMVDLGELGNPKVNIWECYPVNLTINTKE